MPFATSCSTCPNTRTYGNSLLVEQLASSPVTAQHIRSWTERDPLLSHVLQFVQNGKPKIVDQDSLKPFSRKNLELFCQEGCILWGNRVVIPKSGKIRGIA